jgi:hypothetical protein
LEPDAKKIPNCNTSERNKAKENAAKELKCWQQQQSVSLNVKLFRMESMLSWLNENPKLQCISSLGELKHIPSSENRKV